MALAEQGVAVDRATAAGLCVRFGEREAEVGLASLSRVLALAPLAERAGRLGTWAVEVRAALEGERPVSEADVGRLVPRLLAEADPRVWSAPLAPGLHLALALDSPLRQRLLSPFDLPRLGLSLAAARQRAMQNLRERSPPPETDGTLSWWGLGDGLDASRLLLAGAWATGAPGVIAIVPARDLCAFLPGPSEDAASTAAALLRWAEALPALPYPLSLRLWWLGAAGEGPQPLAAEAVA